ncbi:BTB/POZ and math domain-containing protein 4 [Phtheirospermum japonicum]|uniref:BTB/POZ and math domain-containing protein 4 n=1 Tax=Phtheirospermum japonicum TaxID=374723 RepID=A0A830CHU7_9LAMI|nr:BTB/POZ and math domain-containing protein 4 [Phtheirospermum japonicum]
MPKKCVGHHHFIERGRLERSSYLKDDCLKIESVSVVLPPGAEAVTPTIADDGDHDDGVDFLAILDAGEGCDVVFNVRGEERFSAHNVILSARSPVFRSMFVGSDQRELVITSMEPRVFKSLLHFIYSDTLPEDERTLVVDGYAFGQCVSSPFGANLLAAADADYNFKVVRSRFFEDCVTQIVVDRLQIQTGTAEYDSSSDLNQLDSSSSSVELNKIGSSSSSARRAIEPVLNELELGSTYNRASSSSARARSISNSSRSLTELLASGSRVARLVYSPTAGNELTARPFGRSSAPKMPTAPGAATHVEAQTPVAVAQTRYIAAPLPPELVFWPLTPPSAPVTAWSSLTWVLSCWEEEEEEELHHKPFTAATTFPNESVP